MTCLTRIPAGIGFKQFPFISYDALPCSPSLLLSLSRSSSVVNFAPLSSSGSFSSTQFRWKYIDKFQEKKRVRFILLSLNRFCRRCIPLFCFVFHIFYENIIKSTLGHCRVTDRKKISWHIVIVSCFFCHSLSLSFSFHFTSYQFNWMKHISHRLFSEFSLCKCTRQQQGDRVCYFGNGIGAMNMLCHIILMDLA